MTTTIMLSEDSTEIAVNMVPLSLREGSPVRAHTAVINRRDSVGSDVSTPDRIYITEDSGINQIYDFVVDYQKIDISDLLLITPLTVDFDLVTNDEDLASLLNSNLGTNLTALDIVYDPVPVGSTEATISIDKRSLIYTGEIVLSTTSEYVSTFAGVEITNLPGFL